MRPFLLLSAAALLACNAPTTPAATDKDPDSVRAIARADSLRRDSLRDGHHRMLGPTGRTTLEGDLRNGKRHGVWTSYNADGRTKSRNEYVDGVLEGPTITFHDNGAVYYQGQYLHDKAFGKWSFFDEKGGLIRTAVFDSTGTEVKPK